MFGHLPRALLSPPCPASAPQEAPAAARRLGGAAAGGQQAGGGRAGQSALSVQQPGPRRLGRPGHPAQLCPLRHRRRAEEGRVDGAEPPLMPAPSPGLWAPLRPRCCSLCVELRAPQAQCWGARQPVLRARAPLSRGSDLEPAPVQATQALTPPARCSVQTAPPQRGSPCLNRTPRDVSAVGVSPALPQAGLPDASTQPPGDPATALSFFISACQRARHKPTEWQGWPCKAQAQSHLRRNPGWLFPASDAEKPQ